MAAPDVPAAVEMTKGLESRQHWRIEVFEEVEMAVRLKNVWLEARVTIVRRRGERRERRRMSPGL